MWSGGVFSRAGPLVTGLPIHEGVFESQRQPVWTGGLDVEPEASIVLVRERKAEGAVDSMNMVNTKGHLVTEDSRKAS